MLQPNKSVVTIVNYCNEQKTGGRITKTKRIAQVLFQAKNAPLEISQEQ